MHGTIGLRRGWAVQILNRVHQKKGLRAIGTTMDGGEISEDDKVEYNEIKEKEPDVRDSYWAYPDPDIIFEDFKTNQPLCLICTKDGVFGAMLRTGIMVEFDFDTKKSVVTVRDVEFFDWRPRGYVEAPDKQGISFSCVLLPLQLKEGNSVYAAIREDYTMFTGIGEFK